MGARLGATLHKLLYPNGNEVVEGPRAISASLVTTTVTKRLGRSAGGGSASGSRWRVAVRFSGGTAPFHTAGTKNCTSCCDATKDPHTLDFDATCDGGASWVNGTVVDNSVGAVASTVDGTAASTVVTFEVTLATAPTAVRYTAGAIFPQCALYNAEGLPAVPFEMTVTPDVPPRPSELQHLHTAEGPS